MPEDMLKRQTLEKRAAWEQLLGRPPASLRRPARGGSLVNRWSTRKPNDCRFFLQGPKRPRRFSQFRRKHLMYNGLQRYHSMNNSVFKRLEQRLREQGIPF